MMKTIGLIGGLSWESTLPYYRVINETIRDKLGGLASARLVLVSLDFSVIAAMQHAGDWEGCARILEDAARSLRAAGADCVAICSNTMHKLADGVEAASGLPLLHIADATAATLRDAGLTRIGLLGTRFTMEQDFYRNRLQHSHGIDAVIPDEASRLEVNRVIYEELCRGEIRDDSRRTLLAVARRLTDDGAQGIVLGCTELPMLLRQEHLAIPLFDTGLLHARFIAAQALA